MKHSTSVPLVFNPSTGSITPQFHVVFDDYFATVSMTSDDLPDLNSDTWMKMFGASTFQFTFDEDDLARMDQEEQCDADASDTAKAMSRKESVIDAMDSSRPTVPLDVPPPPTSVATSARIPQRESSVS